MNTDSQIKAIIGDYNYNLLLNCNLSPLQWHVAVNTASALRFSDDLNAENGNLTDFTSAFIALVCDIKAEGIA